ncbi:hypothetical protein IQ241_09765 [Romeria aff. gracilis LEGE 07310]|uniref:Uncharacterized protein n=1 Tax=Vasconcelosia minhoensis LEGE 07310 TaxID=915328 RepID=A0A8J7ADM2_9CYAN|nr:hypothetical protein [Romeria gracilis]MBE9077579.1 hypothetical protein [Romeria aff. gracilis LEGE 07310]
MEYEVTIRYSSAIARAAARQFFFRFVHFRAIIGGSLLLLACAGLLALKSFWRQATVFGGIGIVLIVLCYLVGWLYISLSVERFRKLDVSVFTWRFTHHSIGTLSELGTQELSWKRVTEVWRFPQVWLIFFHRQGLGYSMLPTAALSRPVKQLIVTQVRAHGGKVS